MPEYVDQLDLIYSIANYKAPLTREITPTDRTFIEGDIFFLLNQKFCVYQFFL